MPHRRALLAQAMSGLLPAVSGRERRAAEAAPGCCQRGWEILGAEWVFWTGVLCRGSWMPKAASCCWPHP